MNAEQHSHVSQEELDRAAKDAWREREGWCSVEEARQILSGVGSGIELVEPAESVIA